MTGAVLNMIISRAEKPRLQCRTTVSYNLSVNLRVALSSRPSYFLILQGFTVTEGRNKFSTESAYPAKLLLSQSGYHRAQSGTVEQELR